jgi:ubiquinone/menaquinone biosynthesis C-methylase UbiE
MSLKRSNGAGAALYERLHGEIFNAIEQQRLHAALQEAVDAMQTGSARPEALDYGCGSGNLTRHLMDLGVRVVCADVSDDFLKTIEQTPAAGYMVWTLRVNGADLSNLADARFDLVATYSVLHHVPDYLRIVEEMCRVTKPGGVIYIDHEVTETYYQRPAVYVEFLKRARPRVNWRRLRSLVLDVRGYIHILRRLVNPRYKREGDIHVWPDDHIEWDKIEKVLAAHNFEILVRRDYLLYKAIYDAKVYDEYRNRCADERVLIARRKKP